MCGQQQPIFRKVVEIYGDLQRFARLRWTLPSTQYVCVEQHRKYVGRPKSGLCTMIMRQWGNHLQFTILVIQFDDMISNTIWYKCPAEWSHLGSDVRHQRRRRLRTSSQGGKPTLLGRADAFFSPFVLRMLCLGGLAWYWVLGVGPTGYTESRQPAGRTPPGILNQASTRTRLSAQTHKETLARESVEKSKLQKHFSRFQRFKSLSISNIIL